MLIKGTRYADDLTGTDYADQIYGGGGNDDLVGYGGDDLIQGNTGNDRIYGDAGNDDLRGGQGDDTFWDWQGADFVSGGRGTDILYGDAVDYQRDTLHGGLDRDVLYGGTGFDLMIGGEGDDTILAMGGEYYGDQGPGLRQTSLGNDYIYTSLANDYGTARIMTGGLGSDTYRIDANAEGVATAVTITDFNNAEDHVVFLNREWYGLSDLAVQLDKDHNSQLNAADGWSGAGNVTAGVNSLILTVGDGDSLTFLNTTHLDFTL